jgi:hypothetical protein
VGIQVLVVVWLKQIFLKNFAEFFIENRHPHAQPQGLRRVGIQVLVVVWLKQIFFGNFIEIFSRKSSSRAKSRDLLLK